MKLVFLGSGTSHGIPCIGCACPVCRSADSRDWRKRASLYILGANGERLVIDTGPEFRLQALQAGITWLDGILLTHAHADHLHGLDDVRPLCKKKPLPLYGNAATLDEVRERFAYVFKETQRGGGKPRLNLIHAEKSFRIGGLTITPVPVKHGALDILGWSVTENPGTGTGMAYLTDTSRIPPSSFTLLGAQQGKSELLIIGALRIQPHPTHFNFHDALNAAKTLNARRVYLTHISHEHSHREIEAYCKAHEQTHGYEGMHISPAYDGLELETGALDP